MPRRTAQPAPMDPEDMRVHAADASRLLKALANEKRLMLLCLLAEGEHSVGDLNARLELSQSALSQHLAKLREELRKTKENLRIFIFRRKAMNAHGQLVRL